VLKIRLLVGEKSLLRRKKGLYRWARGPCFEMETGKAKPLKARQVGDLMTRDVVKAPASMTVKEAAALMKKNGVGSLLVSEGQNVVGIVTETDIVHKVVSQDLNAQTQKIESIMSFPLLSIEAEHRVDEAAEVMIQNGIRHLAVTQQGQVVGVISMRDLLRPFYLSQERSGP
jgi:signal-transduction protein with cAMP-binding, CBS, and nucleotidyltransferase domain